MVSNEEFNEEFSVQEFASFKDLHLIGEGTYGKVWKGRNASSNELLAIKKIKTDITLEGIPSTTLREICLLKELNHPNIV
jgi:serine/threonine protein kinase